MVTEATVAVWSQEVAVGVDTDAAMVPFVILNALQHPNFTTVSQGTSLPVRRASNAPSTALQRVMGQWKGSIQISTADAFESILRILLMQSK